MTIDEAAKQQRARRHRFKPCPSGNPIADMHFHEATGITVRGIAADSDQDMFTKLRAGGGDQYDIVFADAGFCPLYHNAGLTEPLDLNEIPAAKNLLADLQDEYRFSLCSRPQPGWLSTGDVVTMDADGYFQVVDRSKDVIKSGGEWISSIELENIALSHPAVQEAACVARPDAHWGERPLLVVVARPDAATTEEEILSHFSGRVPRWRIPDSVVFAPELPHTATGKLLKTKIRELYCMAPKSREFGMLR